MVVEDDNLLINKEEIPFGVSKIWQSDDEKPAYSVRFVRTCDSIQLLFC